MADDTNQYPINSDAALTSDDPQSQVASQGWQQIGQTAPVQQAMDFGGNLDRYNEMLNSAVAGNPEARMQLAQHSLGTAMGTMYKVSTPNGLESRVLKNPTPTQAANLAGKAKAGTLKYVADNEGNLHMWDAYDLTHADVMSHNGMSLDPDVFTDTGVATNPKDASNIAEMFLPKNPKPTAKTPDKLPMDEASRMARAKDMGFDTSKTYYHGTANDFDRFKTTKSPNGAMLGQGTYLTEDPEYASKYAAQNPQSSFEDKTGGRILPVHTSVKNPFDLSAPASKKVITALKSEPGIDLDLIKHLGKPGKDNGDVLAAMAGSRLPYWRQTQILEDAGHDAVKDSHILSVFDPKDIRSKFAEFDPKQKKSGKLSYADGGEVQSAPTPMPPAEIPQPVATPAETHVVNQWGDVGTLPTEDVQGATTDGGYTLATPEQIHDYKIQKAYGTPGQQLKGAAESLAQGIAGPAAPIAEKKYLGVKDEDIRGRAEANPKLHMASEIAGLIAPAFLPGGTATGIGRFTQAGLLESAGKATAGILGAPTTLSGKMGVAAAKAAVENMLLAGSDETSRVILNDPNASAEHAIANIGLAGVLGGAIGGGIGAVSPLLKGPLARVGQEIENFKGRIAEHTNTPDPVGTMGDELKNYFEELNKVSHETYGSSGIKIEAIHKLMPEMTDAIATQANGIADNLDSGLQKLAEQRDPHAALLQDKVQRFKQALNTSDPATIFDATQTLKQQLQAESRYIEGMTPLSERLYRGTVKNLAHDLRTSLEDRAVWGKAADVQASVNSAASKYIAATKDFKNLMTTKVMGESTIDPGKIQTYLNQLGKANAEIKQTKLQNFLDHGDELKNAVSKAYETIGAESPIQPTPLNYTLSTLGAKTAGSKLADIFIKKGLTDVGGQAMGGAIGGGLGHLMGGHGAIGALVGQHALGPFFSSVLPGIAKAIVSNPASSLGFKAAVDHGLAVAKSESLLTRAAKSIFKVGSESIADSNAPNIKQREKLDKILKTLQATPAALLNNSDKTGHYLPAHAQAMSQSMMNATNYLNGLRADNQKKSPLDSTPVLSAPQKAAFNNALDIANKPAIIFDKIKSGTLTTNDITSLHAMYPALYDSMKSKVMDQIVNSENKDKPIPYKMRQSLSLFIGQPLDSTMTPASIMAIQNTTQSGKQNAQAQQAPAPKRSTSSLNKLPGMYKTPSQTTEGRSTREK